MTNPTFTPTEMELLADATFREAGRLALDGAELRAEQMVNLFAKLAEAKEATDGEKET